MTSKFKVGDKVIPVSKSFGDSFDKCKYAKKLKANEVNFLYVVGFQGELILLNSDETSFNAGSFYKEEDLKKFISKNQRITALEETVAKQGEEINELKLIVAQIRKPSTAVQKSLTAATSVEDIIEFEGAQYKKVDREAREGDVVIIKRTSTPYWLTVGKPYKTYECPMDGTLEIKGHNGALNVYDGYQSQHTLEDVDVYELIVENKPQSEGERLVKQCEQHFSSVEKSPNKKRAEMIEKAKVFVEEAVRYGWDDGGCFTVIERITNDLFDEFYVVEFYEKQQKITAVVTISSRNGKKKTNKPTCVGRSKCAPSDVFNEHIGKAIALGRALGLDVSEFEQVVQPTIAVGQVVKMKSDNNIVKITEIKKNSISDEAIYFGHLWAERNDFTIIDDTNAIYGGGE